jgi:hypothetical protein
MKERGNMTESKQQQLLISWFKLQYPGKIIFAIPNGAMLGGANRALIGRIRKREGLLKGVSDLFLPIQKGDYAGCFIEMKNIGATRCKVSEDQKWFLDEMNTAGYKAEWCAGFDAAKEVITEYMKGR